MKVAKDPNEIEINKYPYPKDIIEKEFNDVFFCTKSMDITGKMNLIVLEK